MNESNPQNDDIVESPFDFDQGLISGWLVYNVNDDIVETFNNKFIFEIYMSWMQEK